MSQTIKFIILITRSISTRHRVPLLLCLVFIFGNLQAQPIKPPISAAAPNPILPGDHPDPTIVRIRDTYWTASTSGNWAPGFPLYRSTDLRHWTAAGAVFPQTPEWASGSFWAPEMVADHGRVLVYYVGRKRGGPLCVAVATASQAEGPYTDHGPIVCQPDGSIDPSFVRDEHGDPFLIWKEDGNSERKPTPIWAQPLTSDLLQLTGSKTQLLVNDPASWEGGVVEGPYIFRHAGRFYLFYAGNACCGLACNYAEGVARADRLLGPWERDPTNPIIAPNAAWKCPGHGTAVETPTGKNYFIYHAYPSVGTIYLGRESLLDPITWGSNGWPAINRGRGPSGGNLAGESASIKSAIVDDFRTHLDPEWRWPVGHAPVSHVGDGHLTLEASTNEIPAFLARSLMAAEYVATVGIDTSRASQGGLGLIGDAQNAFVLAKHGNQLELSHVTAGSSQILWQTELGSQSIVWLRVSSDRSSGTTFSYSLDRKQWISAGSTVSLGGLPPWDQGLRISLVNNGLPGSRASFIHFTLGSRA
jgi:beta-xylosidase